MDRSSLRLTPVALIARSTKCLMVRFSRRSVSLARWRFMALYTRYIWPTASQRKRTEAGPFKKLARSSHWSSRLLPFALLGGERTKLARAPLGEGGMGTAMIAGDAAAANNPAALRSRWRRAGPAVSRVFSEKRCGATSREVRPSADEIDRWGASRSEVALEDGRQGGEVIGFRPKRCRAEILDPRPSSTTRAIGATPFQLLRVQRRAPV
jgi:hypothetical protein